MKKQIIPIDLEINNTQTLLDPRFEPLKMNISTDGVLETDGKQVNISYDEIMSDDSTMFAHTVISYRLDNKNIVSLSRTGDVITDGIFEKGSRYRFLYQTPFGTIEFVTATSFLNNDIDEKEGGKLRINYTIEHTGSALFTNEFEIVIKNQKGYISWKKYHSF